MKLKAIIVYFLIAIMGNMSGWYALHAIAEQRDVQINILQELRDQTEILERMLNQPMEVHD